MKKMLFIAILSFALPKAYGQILNPVKWSYGAKRLNNGEAVIFLKAEIEDGWHIYSAYQKEGGPVPTSFIFSKSSDFELAGTIVEPKSIVKYEDAFKMDVHYFEHEVIFQQKIKIKNSPAFVLGTLKYMCCNDHQCLAPETVNFNIPVK